MQSPYNSSKLLGRTDAFDSRSKLTAFDSPSTNPSIKTPSPKSSQINNQLQVFSSEAGKNSQYNRYKDEYMKLFGSHQNLDNNHKDLKTGTNPQIRQNDSKLNVSINMDSNCPESTECSVRNRILKPFPTPNRKNSDAHITSRSKKTHLKTEGQSRQKIYKKTNNPWNMPIDKSISERRTKRLLSKEDSQQRLKCGFNTNGSYQKQTSDWNNNNETETNDKLLSQILQTIENQPQKFNLFGDQIFKEIRSLTQAVCYNEEIKGALASSLMQYMQFCQDLSIPKHTHPFEESFVESFGKAIYYLHEQMKTQNVKVLQTLCFLIDSNEFQDFKDLKFDLSPIEVMKIIKKTQIYSTYDQRAFIFFTNYMYLCILKLDKKGKTLKEIDEVVKINLEWLLILFSSNIMQRQTKDDLNNQNLKLQIAASSTIIKEKSKLIMDKLASTVVLSAQEACMTQNCLQQLLESIINTERYYLDNQIDFNSIQQIILQTSHIEKRKLNPQERQTLFKKEKKNAKQIVEIEEKLHMNSYEEVYRRYEWNNKAALSTSKILKGMIKFQVAQDFKMSNPLQNIKQTYNLIESESIITDSKLKMQISVSKTLEQVSSVFYNLSFYHNFHAKIHQILNNTQIPLIALKLMNQLITNKFMNEAKLYIEHYNKPQNIKLQRQIFENTCSFETLSNHFYEFEKMINWEDQHLKIYGTDDLQARFKSIMNKSENLSILPRYVSKAAIQRNTADFYRTTAQFDKAILLSKELIQTIEVWPSKKPEGIQEIVEFSLVLAHKIKKSEKISPLIPLYQRCYEYLSKVTGKNSISSMYCEQSLIESTKQYLHYLGAILIHKIFLEKLIKDKKKYSEEGIYILSSIGNLHATQQNYKDALQKYIDCLNIIDSLRLNGSQIHLAILKNISSVFGSLSNNKMSVSCLQMALQIEDKLRGKGEVDIITSHGLIGTIYQNMSNYDLAIKEFYKQIAIQSEARGKDTLISLASRLNKAATIYEKGLEAQALKEYTNSLSMVEKRQGKVSEKYINTLMEIGEFFMDKRKHREAIGFYKQSIEKQIELTKGPSPLEGQIAEKIGFCYYVLKDWVEAQSIYQYLVNLYRKIDSTRYAIKIQTMEEKIDQITRFIKGK